MAVAAAACDACEPTARWVLQRRCSLTPPQLGACLLALVLVSALIGGFFWLMGARAVTAFAGLEALALTIAFGVHAVHAADGERVTLHGRRLTVERRRGWRVTEQTFGVDALRLAEAADGRIELRARGRVVHLGEQVDRARAQQVLAELRQACGALASNGRRTDSCWS